MKTGNQTTYILLDRGTEDMELLAEINRIIVATGIQGSKEFVQKYPCIHELKLGLIAEKEIE